jgi:serine/threonine-protein kinase
VPAAESGGLCPRCRLDGVPRSDTDFTDLFTSTQPGQVLESLAASIGLVPRILLSDTAGGTTESPLVNPSSAEMPLLADRSVRVQLLGEIARGGMGVVLKGRDPDLGRDLAVKVLLDAHKEKPDLVRRFVEEAQIGGQLQHPGVVPVYELGTFGDRRPYFTMKLVKGQTLAELLAERDSPAEDLPRLLGIFEQVCQTMAYAHARDVIHRDLKPSNVMVGSFGEVQVMDWGLAKVLPKGGVVDDAAAGKIPAHETVIATARVWSDSDLSQAGSVMGTPAYMAPEQARGEIDLIDERADVFALGSILCEVLTGQPAFVGRSAGELHRKAALGDLAEAMAALEGSGADGELIALARDCLEREAEDRPRHAGAVAERITAYLVGVQEKLRATEIARATEEARAEEEAKRRLLADELAREAQAHAEESRHTAEVAQAKAKAERRARRLTGALAASVLGLVMLTGGAYAWFQRQRTERQARVDLALLEAEVLRSTARQAGNDLARWRTAREAAHAVERLLADARDEPTRKRVTALVESVSAEAKAAENDQKLLDRLIDIRSAKADDHDGSATDPAYAALSARRGSTWRPCRPPRRGPRSRFGRRRSSWPCRRPWTTGPRCGETNGATVRVRNGWPRPLAPPIPTRGAVDSATRSTHPRNRNVSMHCARWPARPRSTSCLRSTWICWAPPCATPVIPRRPRACCVGPSAASLATSGSTTTWPSAWRSWRGARKRSATTRPPARSGPRPPTSWRTPCETTGKRMRRSRCSRS